MEMVYHVYYTGFPERMYQQQICWTGIYRTISGKWAESEGIKV